MNDPSFRLRSSQGGVAILRNLAEKRNVES